MTDAPKPKVNATLICERVIKEEGTGLTSLISIFEKLTSTQLPVTMASLFFYAKLTETQGEYLFKVTVVRRDTMAMIAEAALPSPVPLVDPMATSEIVMQLGGLTFNEAGHYDFRLSANGMFLESKSIEVVLKSE